MSGQHRRVPFPFRGKWPGPGHCRWCGGAIYRIGTADLNRRKSWHTACVDQFLIASGGHATTRAARHLDGGKCRCCGRAEADDWNVPFEADHITPLCTVDRDAPDAWRFWTIGNLQWLCRPCHKAKCAREAAAGLYRPRHRDQPRTADQLGA